MPTADSESTITAGKNHLAAIIIFGQLKSNELLKDHNTQLPNNAKALTRELIAATARTVRPECTAELVRDILHYRSRKSRTLWKEFKSGKLHGDSSLADRLIEAEKALLNSLETEANIPTTFLERPDISPNCVEILNRMYDFVVDPVFRNQLLQSLPSLPPTTENGRSVDVTPTPKEEDVNIKNDQESDGDSVHASSSSYEDQSAPPVESAAIQHVPLMPNGYNSVEMNGHIDTQPSATPIEQTIKSRPRSSTAKKRRLEDNQMELINMKKDMLHMQQMAFERQIQMCDEMVKTLNEMRCWIEIQRRTSTLLPIPQAPANPVQTQLSNYLPASLLSTPLPNLSSLSSFLANATDSNQPLI
ncbi:hypothetical protein M3Y94_00812400 [Aphelenchoides besseyi]|nr:hypothetical protein M3Y94_00812400 [Aphelenchoides besseyi]KAI6227194.1 hypothetical protein M3Y95_00701000 [Aphelenchoides besseyi]